MHNIFKDENSFETLMSIFKSKIEVTERASLLLTQKIQASQGLIEAHEAKDDESNKKVADKIEPAKITPDRRSSDKFEIDVSVKDEAKLPNSFKNTPVSTLVKRAEKQPIRIQKLQSFLIGLASGKKKATHPDTNQIQNFKEANLDSSESSESEEEEEEQPKV